MRKSRFIGRVSLIYLARNFVRCLEDETCLWFTATARTRARFARTFGKFWLGLSNLLSIGALALVYGTVFKVQDFSTYGVFRHRSSGVERYKCGN